MIRVLIADDEALVRGRLRMIIEAQPDMDVSGEAEDGRAALDLARRNPPDVVLMDIRMPGVDGIEATRRLLDIPARTPRILILTTFDLDEYVYEAMRAGASGFLLKSARPQQLISAVRGAVAGETLLAPQITRRLVETFVRRPPTGNTDTARARRAHQTRAGSPAPDRLRALQRRDRRAAVRDRRDQQDPRQRIFMKLGLRDRIQAVILAYECGLIETTPRAGRD